jgi:hypothetical protein
MAKNKGGYLGGGSLVYVDDDMSNYAKGKNYRMYQNLKNRKKSLMDLEREEYFRKLKEEKSKNND